eukprot:2167643-Prymnesium_polylepis.1
MDCRRRLAAPPTVRVHGEHRTRPHEQSDCMGAHSKACCVPPAILRLLPSTSEARNVPSQVREARTERFVKVLYGCHLRLAVAITERPRIEQWVAPKRRERSMSMTDCQRQDLYAT